MASRKKLQEQFDQSKQRHQELLNGLNALGTSAVATAALQNLASSALSRQFLAPRVRADACMILAKYPQHRTSEKYLNLANEFYQEASQDSNYTVDPGDVIPGIQGVTIRARFHLEATINVGNERRQQEERKALQRAKAAEKDGLTSSIGGDSTTTAADASAEPAGPINDNTTTEPDAEGSDSNADAE